MIVTLSKYELEALFRHEYSRSGGFQNFMKSLQDKVHLYLDEQDLERIQRYAFDYGAGGWEDQLKAIFQRHLGPNLGRTNEKPPTTAELDLK